jgi:Fic family protein
MVSVVRRRRANSDYYYLYHDSKGIVRRQYEEYLGKSIPPDVEERKNNFMLRILRGEWGPKLSAIHDGFKKERALMPRTIREKNLDAFVVRFTYNTQRIEGSTLSLKDTALLLEDGVTPAGRPIADVREAAAHRAVFLDAVRGGSLSRDQVMEWHRRMFVGTKEDIAGKIRDYNVGVGQSKFVPPPHNAVGALVDLFFEWYEGHRKVLRPVELAALVHLKFVTIHPFGDGNGRVSRLMMNHVLYRAGYPMMDIEYRDRGSYYGALERSQTRDVDWPFLRWFVGRYLRMHSRYL